MKRITLGLVLLLLIVAVGACVPNFAPGYAYRNPRTGQVVTCEGGYIQWTGLFADGWTSHPARGAAAASDAQDACMDYYFRQGWEPLGKR